MHYLFSAKNILLFIVIQLQVEYVLYFKCITVPI